MKHKKTILALASAAVLIIWAICVSTFFHAPHTPSLPEGYVNDVVSSKGIDNVSWDDFSQYPHQDVGSGNYVYRYDLPDDTHLLISGPNLDDPPMSVTFIGTDGTEIKLK
ncbi:hypothetical protein KIH79_05705 [Bifidobacterium sp. 82T10]|uniref:Uncharacterized protein n=1 Tax=Bifidobacterium miconis TaxID=2834435 RepID=A0ABS6WEK4_9BIFI|nr:hypothetical protein [Bifidobacterium miconis]MBW3092445.1 hypothetical protein [Bifidobacterium miconis]